MMARTFPEIILSTGMSTLKEVRDALEILYQNKTKPKNVTLLHCSTEYPTPYDEVNLNAMLTLKKEFNIAVGYSDHSIGIEVPVAAVALGAAVIEKHFTLDKDMAGPDHKASLEPGEFKQMVQSIRNIEIALGSFIKKPAAGELKNKSIARKSIVALKEIKKGDMFSESNITIKRPGTGVTPMKWNTVIGKKAKKDFQADDLITL
jgi:N,N'-diacetyllegionaminate synthase